MNRAVHILTLAFRDEPMEAIFAAAEANLTDNTDVLLLPEMWMGDAYPVIQNEAPVLKRISKLAADHQCYVICPLAFCPDGEKNVRYNSAIVYDRGGHCIYRYDKVFPWWDELHFEPPCTPGQKTGCFQTDFGICGIAICFDVNFPQLWAELAQKGAELVFWPSDYSAGRSLQAHAINHHYYIVTATREKDSALIDICGDEIEYHKGKEILACHYTLDLDRSIFHENFNMEKIQKLLSENCGIILEKHFTREQWLILRSDNEISVKEEAKKRGIEELRAYLQRSSREINPQYSSQKERIE